MFLFLPATESGYSTNKDVRFKKINSIYIAKFRTLEKRTVILGENITIIAGKNGTMKSSILGLIAHPFSSPNDAKDVFNKPLKTDMRNVFRMSLEKDTVRYRYYLNAITVDEKDISEPIRMYKSKIDARHRITVGKDNKFGKGNFHLNTAYINLKRLFPIVDTEAKIVNNISLTKQEQDWITKAYLKIMTREAFTEFDCVSDYKEKNTLSPKNASYDFNSISSGEDNLGNILMKMLAFERFKIDSYSLQGILCIDEIEAALHPVALTNLFDFMLDWSEKHCVQIVTTTHSIYLIDYILKYQSKSEYCKQKVSLNLISTALVDNCNNYRILNNPPYKDAYTELTLKCPEESSLYKVNILCEDDVAVSLLKKLFSRRLSNNLEFISNIAGETGTSYSALIALGKNGYRLLEDSIIVLDPDVSKKDITKVLQKGVAIFIIPDKTNIQEGVEAGVAIEQNIIHYAMLLEGSHEFFHKFGEKAILLNDLHKYNIFEHNPPIPHNISTYKNWVRDNKVTFNSLLAIYVKENSILFEEFKNDILKVVNEKRSIKGLPLLIY